MELSAIFFVGLMSSSPPHDFPTIVLVTKSSLAADAEVT